MERRPLIGVGMALGVSLTAGIALPFVNLLKRFTVGELMIVRGLMAVVLILFIQRIRREIVRPATRTLLACTLFATATVGLYEGIRAWGPSLTLVVITAQPVVNFTAKKLRGQTMSPRALGALAILLLGIILALKPWQSQLNMAGALWSLGATITAGIGFEIISDASGPQKSPFNKTFWLAAVTVVVGFVHQMLRCGSLPFSYAPLSALMLATLVIWGFIGGFLYYLSLVLSYSHLTTDKAAVLTMGETPFVIFISGFLLGEKLTALQWTGVFMAMGATALLGIMEAKQDVAQSTT